MWQLYKILGSNSEHHEYLIDEMDAIIQSINMQEFIGSILLIYPECNVSDLNPVSMLSLLISGLQYNKFFSFVDFVQEICNGSS